MKVSLLVFFLCRSILTMQAQNIGIGTTSPHASAVLDVSSTARGMLVPRMTAAQRMLIPAPAQGLMVYQTDVDTGFYFFKGAAWKSLDAATPASRNLLVYYKIVGSTIEVWTARHDGTNPAKINLQLPANTEFSDDAAPMLSSDGAKIFFTLHSTVDGEYGTDLYSANIDGTGVVKVIDKGGNDNYIILGGVY